MHVASSTDYCKRGNLRVVEIFAIFAVEVFSAKINTTRKFARAWAGYHVASAREIFTREMVSDAKNAKISTFTVV